MKMYRDTLCDREKYVARIFFFFIYNIMRKVKIYEEFFSKKNGSLPLLFTRIQFEINVKCYMIFLIS